MKSFIITALLLAAVVFACNQLDTPPDGSDGPGDPIAIHFCPDTTQTSLCPQLPYEVAHAFNPGYTAILDPNIQPAFDIFSWQSFVALNWPADSTGKPIGNSIADYPDVPRVWEYYPDVAEVFDKQSPLLLQVKNAQQHKQKFFYMLSKMPKGKEAFESIFDPDDKPLIDRNLNFAVFEIRTNPVEADFIISNNLNTRRGIDSLYRKHGDTAFKLPPSVLPGGDQPASPGSMELKTSWRILDTAKGDILSRYYTREALIYVDSLHSVSKKAFVIKATVGLVGMHIVRKTARFQSWIWSTFEHVDNTPDNIQEAQMHPKPTNPWSFYSAATLGLTPNQAPAFQKGDDSTYYRFDSVKPYAKRYADSVAGEHDGKKIYGTQAQRLYPIYYRTQQVNKAWQNKLQGTVWANYKLIGSQWTAGDAGINNTPNVPAILGNSTMETYRLISSSCLSCHSGASITYGKDVIPTDFSFMIAFHAK